MILHTLCFPHQYHLLDGEYCVSVTFICGLIKKHKIADLVFTLIIQRITLNNRSKNFFMQTLKISITNVTTKIFNDLLPNFFITKETPCRLQPFLPVFLIVQRILSVRIYMFHVPFFCLEQMKWEFVECCYSIFSRFISILVYHALYVMQKKKRSTLNSLGIVGFKLIGHSQIFAVLNFFDNFRFQPRDKLLFRARTFLPRTNDVLNWIITCHKETNVVIET